MTLVLHGLEPLHWALADVGISGVTLALLFIDSRIGFGPAGKLAWMFAGGLFIGFGTRLAGGCTSGHGVFGLANLELPSAISALSFMIAGIITTQVIYRVLFPLVGQ